jgi:ABC-2 type transport system permease protein
MTAADDTRAREADLAPLPPMPSLLTVVRARARVEELAFVRDRMALFFTFFFPLVLLLIFGSVFNKTIEPGVTFSQYFVAGMIASGLVGTGFQNLAISIPIEREDGTLKRLSGTPLPKAAYFAGKVVLVLQSLVAQVVLLLLIGMLLFGVKLPSTGAKWFTFAWLLVLGTIACTLLGLAFSSVPKTGRGAPAIVSPVVIILQFVSGVFFVFSELPKWMQSISAIFPLKWLCQGMRSVFLPDSFATTEPAGSWELGRVALVLGIWVLIGAIACATTFRWQRRDDR